MSEGEKNKKNQGQCYAQGQARVLLLRHHYNKNKKKKKTTKLKQQITAGVAAK